MIIKKLKIILVLLLSTLSSLSCSKDKTYNMDVIDLNINLNLENGFSLELDKTSSKNSFSTFKVDSEFNHVFDDKLTLTFSSNPEGYSNSLTFDPSDSQTTISLPYGNYDWEIESSIVSGTAISQKLPVYGQSDASITIDQPDIDLSLIVQTDYSLVTVNTDHVSSVILKHNNQSLALESKDGFFYGYVYSGATSFTLEVIDNEGYKITEKLNTVESCKEYKYTLQYSDVNINSLVCLCEPFEVVEKFLTPCGETPDVLSNGIVAWYPFNGNPNDESGNGNDGTNNGGVLAQDRNGDNNKAYYFSGSGCSTRIDVNVDTSSIETNNSFSFSIWYKHNGNGCIGPRVAEFWPGSNTYGKFTVNTNKGSGNTYNPNIDYRSSEGRMGVKWNLEPNLWTHLVYTIDENEFKIYQNGELYDTNQLYNNTTNQTYYMNSGQTSGTIKLAQDGAFGRMNHSAWDAIDGYLDDIGIWNRVLSDCEVKWLYNN